MGQTRVDLFHLLEDLRDAYPGSTEETILSEIIANALDSGATTVTIAADPAGPSVIIVDNGAGMRRRELARYHDIAASAKVRGTGIGFAGVGIKIALLVCDEVITEARHGRHHVATTWRLASRHKAPWHWVPPMGLVAAGGTAVRLRPADPLSSLLDPGFIEGVLHRNFQPLLDPALKDILGAHYPHGVSFTLNGRALDAQPWHAPEKAPITIRVARKRKPAGAGYLIRDVTPVPEELRGVAVSTFGKVIKRGWDWLALVPSAPERIAGLIEVPGLAECLTLNKADFIRVGARGAIYLAYRRAVQEAVSAQLALWGDTTDAGRLARRRAARPVERDLEAVLGDLAGEFPLLATLVERRAGGQRRLPLGSEGGSVREPTAPPLAVRDAPASKTGALAPSALESAAGVEAEGAAAREPALAAAMGHLVANRRADRRARYGLSIEFESGPDDAELGRLVESTVWVNDAHPAYRRAVASRSEGYHVALAVALALAPLAVDPAKEHTFITAFLARWGAAIQRQRGRRRR